MIGGLRLRGKTLLVLLLVAVIPLLIALIFLSNFTKDQIREGMYQGTEKSIRLVEQTTSASLRELTNYMTLLSSGADLVNSVYYSSLTEDTAQIDEYLQRVLEQYQFDIIAVLDTEGRTLTSAHIDTFELTDETQSNNPVIQASIAGETKGDIETYHGKLTVIVASPVKLNDQPVGHLVGAYLLDDKFARQIKEISGTEVAFLSPQGVVGASHGGFSESNLEAAFLEGSLRLGDKLYFPTERKLTDKARIVMATDLETELQAMQSLRTLMAVLIVLVVAVVFVAALLFSQTLTKPLVAVVDNLKEIAQGEADLTRTLSVSSKDEVGDLATNFNLFVQRLRDMVQRFKVATGEVTTATSKIRLSSQDVNNGTAKQAEALESSFIAIQGIDESAIEVADSVNTLMEAVEVSSSATLELGATIEEIVGQVDRLFSTIEGVTSSITEMSVSSQQVADNLDHLSSSSEVTASSITQMDASIKEVEQTANLTNDLSEQASRDAEQGKAAVADTIAGILSIQETVDQASLAITELGQQSGEIGTILTVIDEVADQTRLLALNASIIAAQAGEHGKGFAVVADEIRELAERTATSTQEIAAIIKRLQSGTRQAVDAMQAGNERVKEEADRSKVAEEALDKLTTSSLKSAEQVKSIVRATKEQSRGSQQITAAVNQVASMLQQISSAVKQQSSGIQQLAQAAESMKDIASQVKLSTGEQARGSHQINDNMERVRHMLQQINQASKLQSERSQEVVAAVAAVREIAESNSKQTAELDKVVEDLTRQSELLDSEIGAFKA